MCVTSVLAVLLQWVSLWCYTILSQDYIPAEHRAGKYLLFIALCLHLSLSLCVCVSICLSSHFGHHILTPCLYSVVNGAGRLNTHADGNTRTHTLSSGWPDTREVNISGVASRQCF